jgi:hypothetical protein
LLFFAAGEECWRDYCCCFQREDGEMKDTESGVLASNKSWEMQSRRAVQVLPFMSPVPINSRVLLVRVTTLYVLLTVVDQDRGLC